MFVGVDGCRGGWVAVMLTEDYQWDVDLFSSISNVWNHYDDSSLILVDIPIGLPEGGIERRCDLEARRLLGKRRSSVFPVPCRRAVYASNYQQACDINEQRSGRRLSKQTWAITPRIREVDELLLNNKGAREKIREIHPEVCFWGLAGGRPMTYGKKKTEGLLERRQILNGIFPHTAEVIKEALRDPGFRGRVGEDDILDAMSAAVTGLGFGKELRSIPTTPEFDAHRLPMEMVFRMMQ